MALTAYELALEAQYGTDRTGKETATRRFVVSTINPAAALEAENLPQPNTSHPDFPTVKLDRYSVSVDGSGVCRVDCMYSADGRFIDVRRPNRDNPAWYHWGWAQRKVQVEIPMAIRSMVLATSGAGTEVEKKVWKIGKKILNETRVIRPLQVRVQINDVRIFDVIAAQTDKLHRMPDGGYYHFEGATVSQVDDAGNYDISYTWERDTGTRWLPPPRDPQTVRYCRLFVYNNGAPFEQTDIRRIPYTVFAAWQDGNPETDVPKCLLEDLYDTDEDGWRLLPGASRII
jgi:hypothetical protein